MSTAARPLPPVHISLGSYGRLHFRQAIAATRIWPPADPLLGPLSRTELQLCPQNTGRLDVEAAQELRAEFPELRFRLHANCRVDGHLRLIDLCDWPHEQNYFRQIAAVSEALQAPAYTAHAGERRKATLPQVLQYTQELEQTIGIPVGIEGHYPSHGNWWLLSTWEEYRQLLESGVRYALDLSHLHILAQQTGRQELGLVRELLASDRCLELHVSANDGTADQHLPLTEAPWWFPLLWSMHPGATVFSEGRLPRDTPPDDQ